MTNCYFCHRPVFESDGVLMESIDPSELRWVEGFLGNPGSWERRASLREHAHKDCLEARREQKREQLRRKLDGFDQRQQQRTEQRKMRQNRYAGNRLLRAIARRA